ncbi:hypothetical protein RHMOL_Rhmol04G0229700 [Rhododendron molle]|uniref:Uncharacterized protein n=1 Tax=Rhododendron molle TaxID=49168 RepID=A0ACC0P3C7_RHOML|nr:hypothetical protein RHMOL_Rhmol04G0229700 [Rhododendron molle]
MAWFATETGGVSFDDGPVAGGFRRRWSDRSGLSGDGGSHRASGDVVARKLCFLDLVSYHIFKNDRRRWRCLISDGSNPVLVRWMRHLWLGSLVVFVCRSPAGGCWEFSIGRGAVSSSCWIIAAAIEDREAGV